MAGEVRYIATCSSQLTTLQSSHSHPLIHRHHNATASAVLRTWSTVHPSDKGTDDPSGAGLDLCGYEGRPVMFEIGELSTSGGDRCSTWG
jgi:hypothetical protein